VPHALEVRMQIELMNVSMAKSCWVLRHKLRVIMRVITLLLNGPGETVCIISVDGEVEAHLSKSSL
jgi:hydrogenase maturation factor